MSDTKTLTAMITMSSENTDSIASVFESIEKAIKSAPNSVHCTESHYLASSGYDRDKIRMLSSIVTDIEDIDDDDREIYSDDTLELYDCIATLKGLLSDMGY